ncbi:class I SAM-dependent methyltransferase, partial [Streptomyces sp. SID7499]|nr:class I SAM-dependent methyltransferase [Streptomyces sp. SID7499]
VPTAEFRCADVRDLLLSEGEFDAVCVYFSLLQMEREEQRELLERLVRSLRPGGLLVAATVPVDAAGVDAVFMGQP